jgi:hypothetical protein
MPVRNNENPIEVEVIEEINRMKDDSHHHHRRSDGGFFFGSIFLILGTFLILSNYLQIDLMQYFWPILLLLLGVILIYRSFNH